MASTLNTPNSEKQERITLSQSDFDRFTEMIEHPAPPTQELRKAMADYRQLQEAHPDTGL